MKPWIKHGFLAGLSLLLFLGACGRRSTPTQPAESPIRADVASPSRSGRGSVTLQVLKAGTGSGTVTSSPSGINCGSTCSKSFSSGTTVTLTATPSAGSVFAGWSGGGTSGTGTATINLTSNTTVTATFNALGGGDGTFTLSVTKSLTGLGNGTVSSTPAGIDCGSTCSSSFPAGTSITLFASPTAGEFTGWTAGPCAGSTNQSCTFTLNANTTATAAFATQPLSFIDTTLADGNVGADYSQYINTTGGFGSPDLFDIVAGSLPDGLVMDQFFGVQSTIIHGRPTRQQTSSFTVRVRDQSGSATRAFTLTINGAVPLAITMPGPTANSGTVGQSYLQNLFGSGGKTPYSWSITAGQLPPGLRLTSASNGNRIDGTPTTRGTFTFTLTLRDQGGQRVDQPTTITIN
jgi:hypothetical protein